MGSAVGVNNNTQAGLPPPHHLSPLQNAPLVSAIRTVPQGLHQKSGTLLPLNGRVENAKYDYEADVSDVFKLIHY